MKPTREEVLSDAEILAFMTNGHWRNGDGLLTFSSADLIERVRALLQAAKNNSDHVAVISAKPDAVHLAVPTETSTDTRVQTVEPVAWRVEGMRNDKGEVWFYWKPEWPEKHKKLGDMVTPLYTHPAKTERPSLSDARIKEIAETLPHGPNQDHPSWGCNYYRKDASGKYIPEVPDNLIPFARALLSTQDFTYDQLEQKVVDILAENEQLSHSNKILQQLLSTQRQDSTDAERYRWIRSGEHNGYRLDGRSGIGNFEVIQKVRDGEAYFLHEDRLDKAIDAAIANGAPK